jgi:hypothetical protein
MKHYIEARIVAECLSRAAPERREGLRALLRRLGADGIWPFYNSEKLGDLLARRGLVRFGRIGSATIRGIRTRVLVDETFPILRRAPRDWFDEPFLEWRNECLTGMRIPDPMGDGHGQDAGCDDREPGDETCHHQ